VFGHLNTEGKSQNIYNSLSYLLKSNKKQQQQKQTNTQKTRQTASQNMISSNTKRNIFQTDQRFWIAGPQMAAGAIEIMNCVS